MQSKLNFSVWNDDISAEYKNGKKITIFWDINQHERRWQAEQKMEAICSSEQKGDKLERTGQKVETSK